MWTTGEDAVRSLSCRRVLRMLQSYLDDALDDTTARQVAHHVQTCRRCAREARTYQEIKRSLGRMRQHSPCTVQRLREFGEALREDPDEPSRTQRSASG